MKFAVNSGIQLMHAQNKHEIGQKLISVEWGWEVEGGWGCNNTFSKNNKQLVTEGGGVYTSVESFNKMILI